VQGLTLIRRILVSLLLAAFLDASTGQAMAEAARSHPHPCHNGALLGEAAIDPSHACPDEPAKKHASLDCRQMIGCSTLPALVMPAYGASLINVCCRSLAYPEAAYWRNGLTAPPALPPPIGNL